MSARAALRATSVRLFAAAEILDSDLCEFPLTPALRLFEAQDLSRVVQPDWLW